MTKTAKIGNQQVAVTCSKRLERQAEWLLTLLAKLYSQGVPIKGGERIQVGWSMVVFRKQQDGTHAVLEPDFDGNPFHEERLDIGCTLLVQMQQNLLSVLVKVPPESVSFQDSIVISKGCLDRERLYMDRTNNSGGCDYGWYIGLRDPLDGAPELEYIFAFQLLQQRPALLAALSLPVGYMALVEGNTIEEIVNSENMVVWKFDQKSFPKVLQWHPSEESE